MQERVNLMKTSNKCRWSDNYLKSKIKWKVKYFMKKKLIKSSTKRQVKLNQIKEIRILKSLKKSQKDETKCEVI